MQIERELGFYVREDLDQKMNRVLTDGFQRLAMFPFRLVFSIMDKLRALHILQRPESISYSSALEQIELATSNILVGIALKQRFGPVWKFSRVEMLGMSSTCDVPETRFPVVAANLLGYNSKVEEILGPQDFKEVIVSGNDFYLN